MTFKLAALLTGIALVHDKLNDMKMDGVKVPNSRAIGIKPSPSTLQDLANIDLPAVPLFTALGYHQVVMPITNWRYRDVCKASFQTYPEAKVPFPDYTQVTMTTETPSNNVIGLLASWIELDSANTTVNEFSSTVLHYELQYAVYLGITKVVVAPPRNLNNLSTYANNMNTLLTRFPTLLLSISLPICEEPIVDQNTGEILSPVIDHLSTWDMWNSVRIQCNYHKNLSVSLLLPKLNIPSHVISRWIIEPVSILLISSSVFVPNSKNYPVLNKYNQTLLWKFLQKNWNSPPLLLLHGIDKPEAITLDKDSHLFASQQGEEVFLGDLSYFKYINFISQTTEKNLQLSPLELICSKFFQNGKSSLQNPLQPLEHNLDNITYEIFEQDKTKYDSYEAAITSLLYDIPLKEIEVLVVGPGRGPLIDRILRSSQTTSKICRITLIEKNVSVGVHLQNRNHFEWNSAVSIIVGDLRSSNTYSELKDRKFNLVVSELLGSLGDNELSPECLYPVQEHCLNGCIFIPQKVVSLVAPLIVSPQVYSQISSIQPHKPYLILLNQFEVLSSKFREIWRFNHPDQNQDLKRFNKVSFKCHNKGLIHGIIGCFKLTLYKDIEISNHPSIPHPNSLTSWLPILFPLETPIFLSDDQEVEILMKRDFDSNRVWYEWSVESFIYLLLPPQKGRTLKDRNAHNSVFGGIPVEEDSDDCQVRVRTGVTRIHNTNGEYNSMRL